MNNFTAKNILITEDDLPIGNMLEEVLTRAGYGVLRAYSGTEALLILENKKPDLILLDLMLPGLRGEDVLPRAAGIPVIIVSAKTNVDEKVNLLLRGAADYITKPFDTKELLARVAVALRNARASGTEGEIYYKDIKMNTRTRETAVGGNVIRLTRTEYAILKMLMLNPKQVVTKSALLERIAEDTPDCTESSLKIHVSNLRRKLREGGGAKERSGMDAEKRAPEREVGGAAGADGADSAEGVPAFPAGEYIESVWGIGYKMAE